MNLQQYFDETRVTQAEFGNAVGVSQGMVHQWLAGIRRVAAEQVRPVAKATGWRVTPHELRPDLYVYPTDGLPPDLRPDDTTSWPEAVEQCHDPAAGDPGAGDPMCHTRVCGG